MGRSSSELLRADRWRLRVRTWHTSPRRGQPDGGRQKLNAKRTSIGGACRPGVNPSSRSTLAINSLQWRRQVLDPTLECAIVGFRDDDVHVAVLSSISARARRSGAR